MLQVILIGLSAGAAAALLFASVASGSPLAVPLFYLAPLPILIAAIGWSHWAALIAGLVATSGLAAAFGGFFFLTFLAGVALPAWWLGYLALLARPVADAAPGTLEWYPTGHLVFWAALIGAAIVIAAMLSVGGDLESFRNSLRTGLERMLNPQHDGRSATPAAPSVDLEQQPALLNFLVAVLPPAAAILNTMTNVINLWLAERIVKVSGRLQRPSTDLSAMRFPAYAPALAAVTVVAAFVPGLIGIYAGVLAASLMTAYAILGFAVLHVVTRGRGGRPFALGGAYVAVLIFGWPVIVMSLVGLADTVFDLRGRAARKRQSTNYQS
jgi:hypothetical protein